MSLSDSRESEPYARPGMAIYVVGTLAIAWVLAYLDRSILVLLTPFIKRDLSLSDTEISLVQGLAFSMVFALAGLPIGKLCDRYNRRNIIIVGVIFWSISTVLCGMAGNFWELFFARVGVGVGEACLAPASFSLLSDFLSPNRRGVAIGVLASSGSVGVAGSNILGGLLLKAVGDDAFVMVPILGELDVWRFAFLMFGAPGIVLGTLMLTLREPPRRERSKVNPKDDAALLPYLWKEQKVFVSLLAASSLRTMVSTSFTVWGPIVFMRRYGMSPGDVGLMMGSTLLIVGIFAGVLGGHLSDVFQKRYPLDGRIRLGLVIYPGLLACVLLFTIHSVPISLAAYAGVKILGAATGASSAATLQDLVPNELRGQIQALSSLLTNVVALSLGTTLIALVTDFVFRDENMVAWSVIAVGIPCMVASTGLLVLALKPSRELRRGVIALIALPADQTTAPVAGDLSAGDGGALTIGPPASSRAT